ncbi:MAG: ribonuclease Z [Saprospiraceae bacterium]|nr:ribonuclease Z [Saprospiraceae bacterium]
MTSFSIKILGTNAALPEESTITSAQVITVHEQMYVIDCGEGMQSKLKLYKIRRNRINAILISHLHGDHLFGLPGLLTSYVHFQRKTPLTIIGPAGIREFCEVILRLSHAFINFEILIIELTHGDEKIVVYEDLHVEVSAFPLNHRIPTYGYIITEKLPSWNVRADKIVSLQLTVDQIKAVKRGEDIVTAEGLTVRNEEVVYHKWLPRRYAYCSDTVYDERLPSYISGVDVLYHEATYLSGMEEQAMDRMHSTVVQAADIARLSGVGKLVVGHFSVRYVDKTEFLIEGREVFENTILAEEGLEIIINEKKND